MAGAAWTGAGPDRWSQCGAVWPELGKGCLQLWPDQGGHGPAGPYPPRPPPPHGELLAVRRHVVQLVYVTVKSSIDRKNVSVCVTFCLFCFQVKD